MQQLCNDLFISTDKGRARKSDAVFSIRTGSFSELDFLDGSSSNTCRIAASFSGGCKQTSQLPVFSREMAMVDLCVERYKVLSECIRYIDRIAQRFALRLNTMRVRRCVRATDKMALDHAPPFGRPNGSVTEFAFYRG